MRKIYMLLLLLVFVSFASCLIESHEKPAKTAIGYGILKNVLPALVVDVSVADVARITQMWWSASTVQEKYDIEDRYFGSLKIRQIGDTVYIVDVCKINTFGKSLADDHWEIFMGEKLSRKIFLADSNKINVENLDPQDNCHLTIEFVGNDEEYLVTGRSDVKNLYFHADRFSKITYSTSSPVTFVSSDRQPFPFGFFGKFQITSGMLEINAYKGTVEAENDKTRATFLPDNHVKIWFREYEDDYYEDFLGFTIR